MIGLSSKFILPIIVGMSSITAIGSYGAFYYLNRETISFAEYILQDQTHKEKNICKRWKDGVQSDIEEKECKKIISEKWVQQEVKRSETQDKKIQPDLWFNADANSIERALWNYFSKNDGLTAKDSSKFKESLWITKTFICNKEDLKDGKIQVNCFIRGSSKDPYGWIEFINKQSL